MKQYIKSTLGIVGCGVSFFALSLAFLFPMIGEAIDPPPQPTEERIADFAVKLKEATIAKLNGKEYQPKEDQKEKNPSEYLFAGTILIGIAGSGFGLGSFLRNEKRSVSYMAMGLGIAAVVFLWSLAIAAAILFLILVAAVLGGLGVG